MNEAVIYARVSSKDQEREGYSIPAQLKLLRDYVASHDFVIFVNLWTLKPLKLLAGSSSTKWFGF